MLCAQFPGGVTRYGRSTVGSQGITRGTDAASRPTFTKQDMNAQAVLLEHQEQFSKDFLNWFPDNQHIWDAFVQETQKVIRAGFNHYSARTIIHVLRHHSALAERNSGWKINNNISPYLARLFALCYPAHKHLFEYRSTPRAKIDHV